MDAENLKKLFSVIQIIREFFTAQGFLDIPSPAVVSSPGIEPHIHPFQLRSIINNKTLPFYLNTSPEFYMKHLLAQGMEKIFSLNYSFRDEPQSPIHRSQFLMLEWYRANTSYQAIMDDCENLVKHLCSIETSQFNTTSFPRVTVDELFEDFLNFKISDFLNFDELYHFIKKDLLDIPLPKSTKNLYWDDLFFLIFLNKIEPQLVNYPYLLLYEYPSPLAALSTIKKDNPKVCERFEIYMNGIEIGNCFNELVDLNEQKKRFEENYQIKLKHYSYEMPEPKILFSALKKGIPPSSGIALGVERLIGLIFGKIDFIN